MSLNSVKEHSTSVLKSQGISSQQRHELEICILSAVMQAPELLDRQSVEPSDFCEPSHQKLLSAITNARHNDSIDWSHLYPYQPETSNDPKKTRVQEECSKLANLARIPADEVEQILYTPPTTQYYDKHVRELKELIKQTTKELKTPEKTPGLPEIIITARHDRDIVSDILPILYEANQESPTIFRRAGYLCRIRRDEKGIPFVEQLSDIALKGIADRLANFVNITTKKSIDTSPPLRVIRDILALKDWGFSPLVGITEVPVMRQDGSILTAEGYDPATSLYYSPDPKLFIPEIPDKPTPEDVAKAKELILEVICDFPFTEQASKANAIATMFTPILRPLIKGAVPMAVFDKPQPGTGASLLTEVISVIATGRSAAMMAAKRKDEEWRKAITSTLLRGNLIVVIDNVNYLYSPSLAIVLTSSIWRDRILGRNEEVSLPHKVVWIATGNNIKLAGDLPRRVYQVRMDAKQPRPWMRDDKKFKHSQITEWAAEKRGEILAALLTIARAWVVEDMPEPPNLIKIGSYESFCRVVGGVLAKMEVEGFLANLITMYDTMDTETPQWDKFLASWYEIFKDSLVTTKRIKEELDDNKDFNSTLPENLPERDEKGFSHSLGRALSKKEGVIYPNGLKVIKAGEEKHAILWQVVNAQEVNNQNENTQAGEEEREPTPEEAEAAEKEVDEILKSLEPDDTLPVTPQNVKSEEPESYEFTCKCGSHKYWTRERSGEKVCARCHPKPKPSSPIDKWHTNEDWLNDTLTSILTIKMAEAVMAGVGDKNGSTEIVEDEPF